MKAIVGADHAAKILLPTGFRLEGSVAHRTKQVKVASSHNNWQKLEMKPDGKNFILNVELPPGIYHYKFDVDNVDICDSSKPIASSEELSLDPVKGPVNVLRVGDDHWTIRQFMPSTSRKPTIRHYGLYIPPGYLSDEEKHWPTIVFLHGAGECGEEIATSLLRQDLAKKLAAGAKMPFVVIAPHCPRGFGWGDQETSRDTVEILDEVAKVLRIDLQRVYLSGFSMGGYGCWAIATEYPNRFAALAPICGGGNQSYARATAHIPQWAFTNRGDPIVPYQSTNAMVQLCKKAGANIKFTVYDRPLRANEPHDSWTEAYNSPELYEWLLSHKLPAK